MDLSNYETVKERKKRFYKDNPDGRIIVSINDTPHMEYVICTAWCYKNKEDQRETLAWASGNALEIRETELSTSRGGSQYASVNYTSWLENCEESAIGRCLDNAGYAGNDKCSREEMKKVERIETNSKVLSAKNGPDDYLDEAKGTFPGETPPYAHDTTKKVTEYIDNAFKNVTNTPDDYLDENSPGYVINTSDIVPAFDDIGKSNTNATETLSPGDPIPKEYWDDKKNSKYRGLWTTKTDDGKWLFKKAGDTS